MILAAGDTPALATTIIVAVIAALPGIAGILYSLKVRREHREARVSEFGTQLAEKAFRNMERQVARLTEDQRQWDVMRDRMMTRIAALSEQLQLTKLYLRLVLVTLDSHNLTPPPPPRGWDAEDDTTT